MYGTILTRIPHALLMRQYGFLILDTVDADIHGSLIVAVVVWAICQDIGPVDNSAIGLNDPIRRQSGGVVQAD